MLNIRFAANNDMPEISNLYAEARERMRAAGNGRQWGYDKPSLETVKEDIRKKQAYVITDRGHICGVFSFIMGADPTYQVIENGAWLNDAPYGTLHRIAGNGQTKGILAKALSFCEQKTDNIRIDTHEDNKIMRHLLQKYGYQQCGYIYVEDGSQRIAYQKIIR